jgi:hypothetical protein
MLVPLDMTRHANAMIYMHMVHESCASHRLSRAFKKGGTYASLARSKDHLCSLYVQ